MASPVDDNNAPMVYVSRFVIYEAKIDIYRSVYAIKLLAVMTNEHHEEKEVTSLDLLFLFERLFHVRPSDFCVVYSWSDMSWVH